MRRPLSLALSKQADPLKEQLVSNFANKEHFIYLDSNKHQDRFGKYQWIIAWNALETIRYKNKNWSEIDRFFKSSDWCFGHISFDLKNEIEELHSNNKSLIEFELLEFFKAEHIIYSNQSGEVFLESDSIQTITEWDDYLFKHDKSMVANSNRIIEPMKATSSQQDYLKSVSSILDEIQFGNIYETNYCIEYRAKAEINALELIKKLNSTTSSPFSAFYKIESNEVFCASPERYMAKRGSTLFSQPIKGTSRRYSDPQLDQESVEKLKKDPKERSENVMIVDLVRNDLSKIALRDSVEVEELFGAYKFPTVWHLISTIKAEIGEEITFSDILKASFPMGSMTGAPKIKALEIIEKHENFKRNLYSGSIGYKDPSGDFDFNVIIRSLLYNRNSKDLSLRVGSAITATCEPIKEYEECKLKAERILESLN